MVDRWMDRWTIEVIVHVAEHPFSYSAEEAERILSLFRQRPEGLHPLEEQTVIDDLTFAASTFLAEKQLHKSRPKRGTRGSPGKPALDAYIQRLERISNLGVYAGVWCNTSNGPEGLFPNLLRACAGPFMSKSELDSALKHLVWWLKKYNFAKDRAKIRQYEARDFVGPDSETVTRRMEEHSGLVVDTANRYLGRGLCLPELIQAGQIGLYDAAKKFDPSRRFKFSTYAVHRITGEINRALKEANPEAWASVLIPHAGGMSKVRPQLVSLGTKSPALQPEIIRAPKGSDVTASAPRRTSGVTLDSLCPGQYVTDKLFGVGRFRGWSKRTVAGVTREYLDLVYLGDDRVYLPRNAATGRISVCSTQAGERMSLASLGGEVQRRINEGVNRDTWHTRYPQSRHSQAPAEGPGDSDSWKAEATDDPEAWRRCMAEASSWESPDSEEDYPDSYELEEESPAARHARTLLEHLEPREREILERGWGLFGRGEETNAAIGKTLGITKARVGQIRKRALEKLSDVTPPKLTGAAENGGRAEGWRWSFGSPEELARALREYGLDYVGLRTVPDAEPPMEEELEKADEALRQYQRNGEIDRTMRALLRAGLSAPWWAIDRHFRRGGWGGHGVTEEPTEAITILFAYIQGAPMEEV